MILPPEVFSADLSPAEFKTLIAMYQLTDNGLVTASTVEIAEMTGYSTESLRRAFRGLEDKGLLLTTRTKRNFGKYHSNIYRLAVPAPSHNAVGYTEPSTEASTVEPPHKDVGSTHDYVTKQSLTTSNQLLATVSKTHYVRLTPRALRARGSGKEPTMVNRFVDDFDGGGVGGLLPEEVQAKDDPWRKKSGPGTRAVAAAFTARLRKANPLSPGIVNSQKLALLLSKYRKDHQVPPPVEQAIIDLWFEDPRNSTDLYRFTADQYMGVFLAFYRKNLRSGYAVAGIPWPGEDASATVVTPVPPGTTLYASDGSAFPDTPGGRKHLSEYEARIRERTS